MYTPHRAMILHLLLPLLLLPFTTVYAEEGEEEFLQQFLAGDYTLIGREADGGTTYSGRVSIEVGKEGLVIRREIGGLTTTGNGRIEAATADRVKVLRMRFNEGDVAYESTCLIGSDLDNYARLTCRHYRADGQTKEPGFEALFIAPR